MFSIWSTNFNSCSAFSWRTKTLSPHSCSTEVTNFSSQAALQGTRSGHGTHSTVHSVARCVTRVLRGAIVDPRRTSVIKEDEVVSRVNHNNMIFLIQMIVCIQISQVLLLMMWYLMPQFLGTWGVRTFRISLSLGHSENASNVTSGTPLLRHFKCPKYRCSSRPSNEHDTKSYFLPPLLGKMGWSFSGYVNLI